MKLYMILGLILGLSVINTFYLALNWIIVIIGIGFLIFVHELGHFIVAKLEKVRVEAFALGFGFPIFKKKIGETEYRINILPLGGYVKMAGENIGEDVKGEPDEFMSKTPGQRARIVVAGVLMNFIFGIIGVMIAVMLGIRFPAPSIGYVAPGSPAWHSGLKEGDEIIEINGNKVTKFREIMLAVAFSNPKKGLDIKVKRGENILSFKVFPKYSKERGMYLIGISPVMEEIRVPPSSLYYKAGLRTGDKIIKIGKYDIKNISDLYTALSELKGDKIEIVVKRGEKTLKFVLSPPKKVTYKLGIISRSLYVKAIRRCSDISKSGLKEGDIIIGINNINLKNYYELLDYLEKIKEGEKFKLKVKRNKDIKIIEIDSKNKFLDDVYLESELYIGKTIKGYPAYNYLKPGDKIIKINGNKLESWEEIAYYVNSSKGKKINIEYERDGKIYKIEISPKKEKILNLESLGLLPKMKKLKKYNLWFACKFAVKSTKQMIMEIFLMLKALFKREISMKNLGGPVIIFSASYTQLQLGLGYFIYFLAIISINLAVINLFPIPILDGGHLVLLAIEKIQGKPLSEKVVIIANYIGFILLLSLIIYVTFNDILRLIK